MNPALELHGWRYSGCMGGDILDSKVLLRLPGGIGMGARAWGVYASASHVAGAG